VGDGGWQISFHGGDWPRWRGDSKELFYHMIALEPDAPAVNIPFSSNLLSAMVNARGAVLEPDNPKDILDFAVTNFPHIPYQSYDISPDGKRILVFQLTAAQRPKPPEQPQETLSADPSFGITIAVNWTSSLQK
jgi:hypothetical protein